MVVKDEDGVIKIPLGRKNAHTIYSVPESVAVATFSGVSQPAHAVRAEKARVVSDHRCTDAEPSESPDHSQCGLSILTSREPRSDPFELNLARR
jgi:hypothetical protein